MHKVAPRTVNSYPVVQGNIDKATVCILATLLDQSRRRVLRFVAARVASAIDPHQDRRSLPIPITSPSSEDAPGNNDIEEQAIFGFLRTGRRNGEWRTRIEGLVISVEIRRVASEIRPDKFHGNG